MVENSGAVTAEQLAAATEVALVQFAPDLAHPQDQQTSEWAVEVSATALVR